MCVCIAHQQMILEGKVLVIGSSQFKLSQPNLNMLYATTNIMNHRTVNFFQLGPVSNQKSPRCGHTYCARCVMSGKFQDCPVDGQELALVVENIALREQIGGLMVCGIRSVQS